jgi:hypothetical protein
MENISGTSKLDTWIDYFEEQEPSDYLFLT